VALALEAEQLDKRLKAVRNRFDPLNESSLFSVAERDLNAELHEGSTRWQHSGHQISATLWSACATRQTGDAPPIRHR
jgi:predicted ATP-dependent serine protease